MMTRSGSTRRSSRLLLGVFGVFFNEGPQAFHHFGDGLEELRLTGVALRYLLQEAADGLVLHIQWAFGMKKRAMRRRN